MKTINDIMRCYGGRSYYSPEAYPKPSNLTHEQKQAWDEGYELEKQFWEEEIDVVETNHEMKTINDIMRCYGGRSYYSPEAYPKPSNLTHEQKQAWDEGYELEKQFWEEIDVVETNHSHPRRDELN